MIAVKLPSFPFPSQPALLMLVLKIVEKALYLLHVLQEIRDVDLQHISEEWQSPWSRREVPATDGPPEKVGDERKNQEQGEHFHDSREVRMQIAAFAPGSHLKFCTWLFDKTWSLNWNVKGFFAAKIMPWIYFIALGNKNQGCVTKVTRWWSPSICLIFYDRNLYPAPRTHSRDRETKETTGKGEGRLR